MELRNYQIEIAKNGSQILTQYGIVYLAMQMRTGKTVTAFEICTYTKVRNVLFICPKKAIKDIQGQYKEWAYDNHFTIDVVNYESVHKLQGNGKQYGVVIIDEAHNLGSFPKPSLRAKRIRKTVQGHNSKCIFLSGTPTPESYSQLYHQFWVSPYSPYKFYKNFYQWARDYVNVTERNFGYGSVKDYKNCKPEAKKYVKHLFISYTQQQAGFNTEIKEHFITVKTDHTIRKIISNLKKHNINEEPLIIVDKAVKFKIKMHQLVSGTIIDDEQERTTHILSSNKAHEIVRKFPTQRCLIFYKYKGEFEALKSVLGDKLTDDVQAFKADNTYQFIALQTQSGREGINLSECDAIIYYTIDYSAVTYWQSRERITFKGRDVVNCYYLISDTGFEMEIYKKVINKQDFTLSHFKRFINEGATDTK